jgi:predicted lipoprotein with Yx(FWY)xxD motif
VRKRWTATVLLLGLLTACAQDPVPRATEDSPTSSSDPTSDGTGRPSSQPDASTSAPAESGTRIMAGKSDFGTVLFDSTGQAIYIFDVEKTARPRCYGACAAAWPPVLTDGAPVAGKRVTGSLIGTTERTDGTTQVTYKGHPLYFYAHEGKHEVKCHDIFLNGGTWYAVQPTGDRAA